jgi:hypothetical protein
MEFWILLGCAIVVAIVIKTLPTPEERGNAGKDAQAEQAPPARNGPTVVRRDPEGQRNSDHPATCPFANRSFYGPRTAAGARACPRPL